MRDESRQRAERKAQSEIRDATLSALCGIGSGKAKSGSLTKHAKDNIRGIHALSSSYNGKGGKHAEKLLGLVRKHAREITELYRDRDAHFAVEVGDLLILCHELLIEAGKDPNEVMELCYRRYKKKLGQLIKGDK